jgi:hypothetical protein
MNLSKIFFSIAISVNFIAAPAFALKAVYPTKDEDLIFFGQKFQGVEQILSREGRCSSVKVAETEEHDIYLTAFPCEPENADPAVYPLSKVRGLTWSENVYVTMFLAYAKPAVGSLMLGVLGFLNARDLGYGYGSSTLMLTGTVFLSLRFSKLYHELFGFHINPLGEDLSLFLKQETNAPIYKVRPSKLMSQNLGSGIVVGFGGSDSRRRAGTIPEILFDYESNRLYAFDSSKNFPLQATIIPGDSGGGLFLANENGETELIGINSADIGEAGMGLILNYFQEILTVDGLKPRITVWAPVDQNRLESLVKRALGDVKVVYHH